MDCRRVAHELIEYFRFGELDARSEPHLDHLDTCLACRREVGLDRELVHQLRLALHDRVAQAPNALPETWLAIRRRALEPEPASRWARLLPGLRLAPLGATVIVAVALLGPVGGDLFRSRPLISIASGQSFSEAAVNDPVDPYRGRWWLRYTSAPPPSAPASGALPAAEPRARVALPSEPGSGPAQ